MGRPALPPEEKKRREKERKKRFVENMTPEQRARRAASQARWRAKAQEDGYFKRWHLANPGKARQYWLKAQYDITTQQWDSMVLEQEGRCRICELPADLVVDHCHATKRVRGLLCHNCNVAIGHLRHDPLLLERARLYVGSVDVIS